VWHERLHAFECYGCGEFEEIHGARKREPDALALTRQLMVVDHTECWQFDDPEMARRARRHRKKKKLQENMARQAVSWRGR
jgi:hypothetical protein